MIVAIDAGNTAISIGLMNDKKLVEINAISSAQNKKAITKKLASILRGYQKQVKDIDQIFLCTVVPDLIPAIKRGCKSALAKNPVIVGKDICIPIANKYAKPRQVGVDRLVGAYAAKEMNGSPVIIIDLGTAITIDVVTNRGAYDGGIIIPGIRLSAESLFLKTALLPNVRSIRQPKGIVGKSTEESILSGVFFGYGAMCSGLVKELKKKPNLKGAKTILTGGYTHLMKKYIHVKIDKIEKHLVLQGLAILAKAA